MSSAHYLHPEFGYFCPGRGLRREWRVAVVSILFGMIIGASVVRLPAGNDRNGDNASTIARLEGPRAVTVLPVATEPDSSLIDGTAAKGEPNGPIKPFPKRIVRVRLPKDRLSVAAAALARTEPEEPAPVASLSTEAIPVANEEGAAPRAAPAYAARSPTTSQPSAKAKKHQRIARIQTRRRNDEDGDHDRRATYWTGRGYFDTQHRRGAYGAWAYGGPRSWGWY
jgi:hypothetical protein